MSKSLEERKFELSDKFHDNSFKVSTELSKLFLSLSTGILAAFFFLLINQSKEGELEFSMTESIILTSAVFFFSLSILSTVRFMQVNSQRYFFLAQIVDPLKDMMIEDNIVKKERLKKYYRLYKNISGFCFGLGIVLSSVFLILMVFNR